MDDIIEGADYVTTTPAMQSCNQARQQTVTTSTPFVDTTQNMAFKSMDMCKNVITIQQPMQSTLQPLTTTINLKNPENFTQLNPTPVPPTLMHPATADPSTPCQVINLPATQNNIETSQIVASANTVLTTTSTTEQNGSPVVNNNMGKPTVKMFFYDFDFSPLPGQVFQININGELEPVKFQPGQLYQADFCNSLMEVNLPINNLGIINNPVKP
jgi:hypothetical protein